MNTSIVKRFTFEAAHRLGLGYEGKCALLHGHSYKVFVEIRAQHLDKFDMVVDFGNLKLLKKWIDLNLDHKTILHKEDSLVPTLRAAQGYDSVFTMMQNPTAEAIARIIFKRTEALLLELFPEERLPNHLLSEDSVIKKVHQVVSVTVQETATGSASFRGGHQ